MELSDQGGDECDEWEEGCEVGLVEHGADDGALFVGGVNCVGGGLAGEGEQYNEHEDEVLHLIFMIYQIKTYWFK